MGMRKLCYQERRIEARRGVKKGVKWELQMTKNVSGVKRKNGGVNSMLGVVNGTKVESGILYVDQIIKIERLSNSTLYFFKCSKYASMI